MSRYLEHLDGVFGASRAIARARRADLVPAGRDGAVAEFVGRLGGEERDVEDGAGTVVGAAAGAVLWRQHRVLGAVLGASLGRNLPALLDSGLRRHAVCNMGTTGAAVAGALIFERNPLVGFGAGWVAANALVYFGNYRR